MSIELVSFIDGTYGVRSEEIPYKYYSTIGIKWDTLFGLNKYCHMKRKEAERVLEMLQDVGTPVKEK